MNNNKDAFVIAVSVIAFAITSIKCCEYNNQSERDCIKASDKSTEAIRACTRSGSR